MTNREDMSGMKFANAYKGLKLITLLEMLNIIGVLMATALEIIFLFFRLRVISAVENIAHKTEKCRYVGQSKDIFRYFDHSYDNHNHHYCSHSGSSCCIASCWDYREWLWYSQIHGICCLSYESSENAQKIKRRFK